MQFFSASPSPQETTRALKISRPRLWDFFTALIKKKRKDDDKYQVFSNYPSLNFSWQDNAFHEYHHSTFFFVDS
jgi:hypothetical protein